MMGAQAFLSILSGLTAGILSAIVYSKYEVIFEQTGTGNSQLQLQPVIKATAEEAGEPINRGEYAVGGNSFYLKLPGDTEQVVKEDVLALASSLNQYSKKNTFDPQFNSSVLFDNVKVLCYVVAPRQFVGNHAKSIVKSWAYHCNKLIVVSSVENKDLGVINIKMPEGKSDAWSRAKVALQYVHDNFLQDYDWFVKLEHDTVVVPENIRYMVLLHQANIPLYAGHVFSGPKTTGSVHILSKKAVELLVPKFPECPKKVGGMADDLELDECLPLAGMSSSTDGRDQDGVQRFQIVMPDHKLPANAQGYTVWYWRYIRNPTVEGPECCSDYSISFHYVSPNAMYLLEYMIYHMKPFGIGHYTCSSEAQPQVHKLKVEEGGKALDGTPEQKTKEEEKDVKKEDVKKEETNVAKQR